MSRAEIKRLLAHSKIKPFPKWTGPASILDIHKLTSKQLALYSAILDHVRGKANITDFYPLLKPSDLDHLKKHDPEILKKLAHHAGSRASLVRFHRRVFSEANKLKQAGGFAATATKVGSFLAEKGVSLAKAAWNTASKAAKSLARLGAKAAKWVVNNPEKVANLVELVKSGLEIGKVIADMGGAGPVSSADLSRVSIERVHSVDKALQESSTESDSEDWGTKTSKEVEEEKANTDPPQKKEPQKKRTAAKKRNQN